MSSLVKQDFSAQGWERWGWVTVPQPSLPCESSTVHTVGSSWPASLTTHIIDLSFLTRELCWKVVWAAHCLQVGHHCPKSV